MRGQAGFWDIDERYVRLSEACDPLEKLNAVVQDRPKLVDQRRALANQPISSPVQALHVELLVALQIDKAHRWAGRGFRYRLGIPIVVLLRLHVGTNIFRRHQPHFVALLAKLTA